MAKPTAQQHLQNAWKNGTKTKKAKKNINRKEDIDIS